MITIEIKHFEKAGISVATERKIITSEKKVKIFGITILKSIYHYPELNKYEVLTKW